MLQPPYALGRLLYICARVELTVRQKQFDPGRGVGAIQGWIGGEHGFQCSRQCPQTVQRVL